MIVRRGLASALAGLLACFSASGATISIDDLGRLRLSGEIVPGDAERVAAKILTVKPIVGNTYLLPGSIWIDSHGGDVREAMRLASLVKAAYMDVVVVPGGRGVCASSCFFIYLAGQSRSASGIDRIREDGALHSLGPIGIHRPYYRVTNGGPDAAARQERLMDAIMDFLKSERVPQSLIDQMMAHPSNDVYWLNSQEIRSLGGYRAGVEEELVQKCGYSAKREEEMSARDYIRDHESGARACMTKYLGATYGEAQSAAFARMRSGWRPWDQ